MGAAIFVVLACLISIGAWILIIPGIIFMVLYFRKRLSQTIPKKRGFIFPFIVISLGEIFLFPVGWLTMILSCNLKHSDIFLKSAGVLSMLTFICGIAMFIICAVKSAQGSKVKNKTLRISVILFLIGFLTTGSGISFITMLSMSSK